jgi:hypothetical protein
LLLGFVSTNVWVAGDEKLTAPQVEGLNGCPVCLEKTFAGNDNTVGRIVANAMAVLLNFIVSVWWIWVNGASRGSNER